MQGWVVVGAWAAVLVFAAIVLGFTVYEVSWKSRRLSADLGKLATLAEQFAAVIAPSSRPDEG